MDQTKWDHKDIWTTRGQNFLVSVEHWTLKSSLEDVGPQRWNVYGYIYPKHPLYNRFEGDSISQPCLSQAPLHWGCTLLTRHAQSIQFGSDYNHLYDDHFKWKETKEDATEVFCDAEALFNWLESFN